MAITPLLGDSTNPQRQIEQQLAFLLIFTAGASILIGMTQGKTGFSTIGLLTSIAIAGLALISRLQKRLMDPELQRLGYVWLGKLILTFFLLYAGWIPELNMTSSLSWGYDPQRFYIQAQALVENRFVADFVSLNYVGILYYYGIFFAFLGHNPVIPALVNVFMTLLAILFLVQVGYEIKPQRGTNDWQLGLALLIPEVLWYDVMTSRETILMVLLTVMLIAAGSYYLGNRQSSFLSRAALVGCAGIGIGIIRTPILLPAVIILGLLSLLLPSQNKRDLPRLALILAAAAMLIYVPQLSENLGSYDFSYTTTSERMVLGNREYLDTLNWSQQSFGRLLIPNNPVQAILFSVPRAIIYLITPLPRVSFSLAGLSQGDWSDWQSLMSTLSSLLNIALIPLAGASLMNTVQQKQERMANLVFHIPYWTLFLAISAGNQIIHERYRVMADLLLWGCIWLGWTTCPIAMLRRWYLAWLMLLGVTGLIYFAYKFLL